MHLAAKELIDDGTIGKVLTVHSTFCTSRGLPTHHRTPETIWNLNKSKGGGSIFDLAFYNIHHARWTFGDEPVKVFATERRGIEVDNGANIQLSFADGGVAQIIVGFDSFRSQVVEIRDASGSVKIDRARNNEDLPVWLDSHEKDRSERRYFDPVDQFKFQIEHMCDTDMAWIRLLLELTGVEVVALADPNDEGRTAPSKTRVRGSGTPTFGKCWTRNSLISLLPQLVKSAITSSL